MRNSFNTESMVRAAMKPTSGATLWRADSSDQPFSPQHHEHADSMSTSPAPAPFAFAPIQPSRQDRGDDRLRNGWSRSSHSISVKYIALLDRVLQAMAAERV